MKVITGRAKTGKSTYIYDEIKKEIDMGSRDNLILLVPDMMTYQTEYDIIQRLNCDGIMNVEVLSFKRLASKILEEVGVAKTQDINVYGKIMLLKQIFGENTKDLKFFKNASNQEGFIREFNLLIQELKQNLVDPALLEEVSKNIDNYFLKSKLSDIGLIYSKYNEKTMDKYFDEEDKFELVISMINYSEYIKNSKIWIDGFESFNQQRIKFIKSLANYSKSVSLSLNIGSEYLSDIESFDDWEAFKTIYDTYESLKNEIEDIEIVSMTETKITSNEIKLIEKNLFSLTIGEICENTDKINIYSSMNPYTEVEKTAIKIVELLRDHKYRWKDIRVAVGNMDNYGINIKKIFDKYEIPYFLDVKRDIMNHPLSKYILSLLDMFIWNFRHDNVFEYLKTGLSPLKDGQVASLENYALRYGIEGSKWFEEFKYDESNNLSYNENLRKLFIKDFENKTKEFKSLSTTTEITNFIFQYLEKHKIQSKIQSSIGVFLKEDKYEESSEYSQVWNYIMEIFQQLILVGEDTKITPAEYRRILEAGLKEVKISIIPPTIDKIEIGEIARIAIGRPKALFLIGANEGNLDKSDEQGLLLDDEREILIENSLNLISGSPFAYYKGMHMLYKAFSCPTERLYIGYSLGTIEGKTLQPSLYIDTIKRIFPTVKEETDISGFDEMEYVSNYNGTYDILVENIRKYIKGHEIDDIWKDVYTWYKNNDVEKFNILNKGLNYRNTIEPIDPELMDKIYNDDITITVSKLETYAACQYKYFIENILKPKPRLTQKIEMYDLGNINHEVLEDFINKLIEKPETIDNLTSDDVKGMVKDSIDKILEEQTKKVTALDANNRNRYLKEKIQRILYRTADTLVKQLQQSKFRPKYTELHIGILNNNDDEIKNSKFIDSVEIEANDKTVKLRGKIDRVDAFENEKGDLYINIIDYKSSSKDIDLLEASEGIQIQLLVYLNAILQNGEKLFNKKTKVAGVFYYHINDPIIKKDIENPEYQIFTELKLKGYALKDKELLKKIDTKLVDSSDIIQVKIKEKGKGDFYKAAKVLTDTEFEKLLSFIQGKCSEITTNIISGNFEMNPYTKDGITPCQYCDYISVCQFDKSVGNDYRLIVKKDKSVVLKEIIEKGGKADGVDKGAEAHN